MKINEMKDELEKVSKFIPGLRKDLDQLYLGESSGKKSRLKKLWHDYEERLKDLQNSKEYRILQ